ncbi:MAG: hypothetical protein ABI639_02195 [Thermoanaerobaculia bacterium]
MVSAALTLGILWLGTAVPPKPQLTVVEAEHAGACRQVPAGWDSSLPADTAGAATVSADLVRYFSGLSGKFSKILEAACYGKVRFGMESDEREVLRALAAGVVNPPNASETPNATLPGGAEALLTAIASPAAELGDLQAARTGACDE